MTCFSARRKLPGYLDGGVRSGERALLNTHLQSCESCRGELETYRKLSARLSKVTPVAPPPDLAVRIRVQASFGRSRWLPVRRAWDGVVMLFRNVLEPLAVPAAGGVFAALGIFALLVQNVLVGVPVGGIVPGDLPLDLVQPARLESLAPFSVAAFESGGHDAPLLLEATLNAGGEVLYYRILSGPDNADVKRQLDQVLLFSKFRPQINFGRPMGGGRVVLSFDEFRVHG